MENLRLVLILSLVAVLYLIYERWESAQEGQRVRTELGIAGEIKPHGPGVADGAVTGRELTQESRASSQPVIEESRLAAAASAVAPISVETDVLRVQISPRGGTIESVWLLNYDLSANRGKEKFRLLKPDPPNMFLARSGLLGDKSGMLPSGDAIFESADGSYSLKPGEDDLGVVLRWKSADGLEVQKRYEFKRGSYVVQLVQEVVNDSGQAVVVRGYNALERTALNDPSESRFINTYTGGVYYTPKDKYQKVSFEDMREGKLEASGADGWIAMIQHYFLGAWIAEPGKLQTFYSKVLDDNRFVIGKFSESIVVPAGSSERFEDRFYVGPKLQDQLAEVAPGLDRTVDYGWLTVIAQPMYWVLGWLHRLLGNWGWAIIALTVLIKGLFYKLSETSYRSMAGMRNITPRMQALKDRYGDDKERLNQALMELYKTEKINPLGGCLPILVQIPVFLALYWVLVESVELRHAPWILWIQNLSSPDPYYILPVVMGVSMFVQMKLNPPPPDPIQAKVMMSLPFVFTVFFSFFPAGLVLYWTVNNLLSIAQQWHITRSFERESAKRRR